MVCCFQLNSSILKALSVERRAASERFMINPIKIDALSREYPSESQG